MPDGAVYVGRPTKWGNPFRIGDRYASRTHFHNRPQPFHEGMRLPGVYEHPIDPWGWPAWTEEVQTIMDAETATRLFREYITYENDGLYSTASILYQLRNRDLACWCPLDEPCHADVLLEFANGAAS